MSDKPEDIPQWAWYEAQAHADNCERRNWDDEEYLEVRTTIARAILQARSQAFEEIESLVADFVWDEHALAQATEVGKSLHNQAVEISQAIRQHSQKGRDND